MGAKISIVGLANAVILIPVYYTEDDSQSNLMARDDLSRISLGLPQDECISILKGLHLNLFRLSRLA